LGSLFFYFLTSLCWSIFINLRSCYPFCSRSAADKTCFFTAIFKQNDYFFALCPPTPVQRGRLMHHLPTPFLLAANKAPSHADPKLTSGANHIYDNINDVINLLAITAPHPPFRFATKKKPSPFRKSSIARKSSRTRLSGLHSITDPATKTKYWEDSPCPP